MNLHSMKVAKDPFDWMFGSMQAQSPGFRSELSCISPRTDSNGGLSGLSSAMSSPMVSTTTRQHLSQTHPLSDAQTPTSVFSDTTPPQAFETDSITPILKAILQELESNMTQGMEALKRKVNGGFKYHIDAPTKISLMQQIQPWVDRLPSELKVVCKRWVKLMIDTYATNLDYLSLIVKERCTGKDNHDMWFVGIGFVNGYSASNIMGINNPYHAAYYLNHMKVGQTSPFGLYSYAAQTGGQNWQALKEATQQVLDEPISDIQDEASLVKRQVARLFMESIEEADQQLEDPHAPLRDYYTRVHDSKKPSLSRDCGQRIKALDDAMRRLHLDRIKRWEETQRTSLFIPLMQLIKENADNPQDAMTQMEDLEKNLHKQLEQAASEEIKFLRIFNRVAPQAAKEIAQKKQGDSSWLGYQDDNYRVHYDKKETFSMACHPEALRTLGLCFPAETEADLAKPCQVDKELEEERIEAREPPIPIAEPIANPKKKKRGLLKGLIRSISQDGIKLRPSIRRSASGSEIDASSDHLKGIHETRKGPTPPRRISRVVSKIRRFLSPTLKNRSAVIQPKRSQQSHSAFPLAEPKPKLSLEQIQQSLAQDYNIKHPVVPETLVDTSELATGRPLDINWVNWDANPCMVGKSPTSEASMAGTLALGLKEKVGVVQFVSPSRIKKNHNYQTKSICEALAEYETALKNNEQELRIGGYAIEKIEKMPLNSDTAGFARGYLVTIQDEQHQSLQIPFTEIGVRLTSSALKPAILQKALAAYEIHQSYFSSRMEHKQAIILSRSGYGRSAALATAWAERQQLMEKSTLELGHQETIDLSQQDIRPEVIHTDIDQLVSQGRRDRGKRFAASGQQVDHIKALCRGSV